MRLSKLSFRALAFLSAATVTANASAFCRTRTVGVAPDYDATKEGCKLDGVPLFWRNACVGYSLYQGGSKKISYEEAANGISQAFTRWTGASCQSDSEGRSRPSIDVRDLGPVACGKVEYHGSVPNQNVILFRDDSWTHPHQVLGLTTVNFDKTNGEIFGADMELNTFDMSPLAVDDPVGDKEYDFKSVATHEAGHFLGMGHSDIQQSTMYASYLPGQTAQRYLSPDDIEGICSIYRPDGERTVLNTQIFAAPQCDPTPRGGYTHDCYEPDCAMAPPGTATSRTAFGLLGLVAVGATVRLLRRARRGPSSR